MSHVDIARIAGVTGERGVDARTIYYHVVARIEDDVYPPKIVGTVNPDLIEALEGIQGPADLHSWRSASYWFVTDPHDDPCPFLQEDS